MATPASKSALRLNSALTHAGDEEVRSTSQESENLDRSVPCRINRGEPLRSRLHSQLVLYQKNAARTDYWRP